MPALVGHEQPVAAEVRQDRRPAAAAVGEAVQEQERLAVRIAGLDIGEADPVREADLLLERGPAGLVDRCGDGSRSAEGSEHQRQQGQREMEAAHAMSFPRRSAPTRLELPS